MATCFEIKLNEFETLLGASFVSEDCKIPFWSPATSVGTLKGSYVGLVYAVKSCATHWHLCEDKIGSILGKIPIEIDTFAKLRRWCAQQIANRQDEEMRLEMLWRDRVAKIEAQV